MTEYNDIYDRDRNLTGRVHRRGSRWNKDEYGLVVCVWVYDGKGKVLLTRRAPEKSAPGTWENSGGAVKAGEDSLAAIVRELREETGIVAAPEEFELLDACTERCTHYDHYCLCRDSSKVKVILQPGETDGVQWATFEQVHEMIRTRQICKVIGKQFLRHEPMLLARQTLKE